MDNVCHSLAGAVLAECGFAQRTRWATTTMVIGANLPDIDVVSLFFGDLTGLEFRRGWTHGVLAMVVLPLALIGAILLRERFAGNRATAPPLNARVLLAAAVLSVWSHPVLDWLNTYGVRLLMPFSEQWFYGDTLFIIDLVLLALFGTGWWLSRLSRRRGEPRATRPARLA
ncbi:MAG: metal-dependent hydrolase, partial [Gemmatimonadaceae bacterium]